MAEQVHESTPSFDVDAELKLLMEEQEKFLRQNQKPSAKFTRMGGAKKAHEATRHHAAAEEQEEADQVHLVGDVVERTVLHQPFPSASFDFAAKKQLQTRGFPSMRRGESLFGRRRRQQAEANVNAAASSSSSSSSVNTSDSSIHHHKENEEMDDISAENRRRIQQMSIQEIREAQEELRRSLDPQLLAKLMSKKPFSSSSFYGPHQPLKENESAQQQQQPQVPQTPPASEPEPAHAKRIDLRSIRSEQDLEQQSRYLPSEEYMKHQWMQPVKKFHDDANTFPTTIRYDFDGRVISQQNQQDLQVTSGLYHHGDEPNRPGYTMDELLLLARSTYGSQKSMALLILAKILRNAGQQQPTATTEYPTKLPIVLRCALDESNRTALLAGITAVHAYLVPHKATTEDHSFETSLGSVVLSKQQVVYYPTQEDVGDGETNPMSDEQVTSRDPIQGFLRMDLLLRLQFLLVSTELLDANAVNQVLDILYVVAKHSPRSAKQVVATTGLIQLLQREYLDKACELLLATAEEEKDKNKDADDKTVASTSRLELTLQVLQLIRLLCQADRTVASDLATQNVIQSTKGIMALDRSTTESLHIEVLRIWRVCLSYGLDVHCFNYLFPFLCGFTGRDLTPGCSRPTASMGSPQDLSNQWVSALFRALESYCCCSREITQAQHYMSALLNFFVPNALQRLNACVGPRQQLVRDQLQVLASVLSFLAACVPLCGKYNVQMTDLETAFKMLSSSRGLLECLTWQLVQPEPLTSDVALSLVGFLKVLSLRSSQQLVVSEALAKVLVALATRPMTGQEVVCLMDLVVRVQLQVFLASMPANRSLLVAHQLLIPVVNAAFAMVPRLPVGMEFFVEELLTKVLFNDKVLAEVLPPQDQVDETTCLWAGHVFQQMTGNSAVRHHSLELFSMEAPSQKVSCHLVLPQLHGESNLPFPVFWLFCPISRMELQDDHEQAKESQDTSQTRAILRATLKYLRSIGACGSLVVDTLRVGEKLFHTLQLFFAGADVVLDDRIQSEFQALVALYYQHLVASEEDGVKTLASVFAQCLKRFEQLEQGEIEDPKDKALVDKLLQQPDASSQEESLLKPLVERLLAEFVTWSFGNAVFAQSLSLFVLDVFPVGVRKLLWKELQSNNLLHLLQPPLNLEMPRAVALCTGTKVSDLTWIELMKAALCDETKVSSSRGAFALALAVHHVNRYIFGVGDDQLQLSFARKTMLMELVTKASATVVQQVVTHDVAQRGGEQEPKMTCNNKQADRIQRVKTVLLAEDQPARSLPNQKQQLDSLLEQKLCAARSGNE